MARRKWARKDNLDSGDLIWAALVGALVILAIIAGLLLARLNRIQNPPAPTPTPVVVQTPSPTASPTPIDPNSTPTPMANDPATRGTGE